MESACPDPETLQAFAVGDLAGATHESLARHVDGCATCTERLGELDGVEDPLLQGLRTLRETGSSVEAPAVPRRLMLAARSSLESGAGESSAGRRLVFDLGRRLARALSDEKVMLNRFQLIEELGVGSFGHVFKALDTGLDRVVAVKVQRSAANDEERARFQREGRSVAQLEHPSIVSVFDTGETDEGVPFLVTEFVEGDTLQQRMVDGPMEPRRVALLVAEIAEALHFAHEHGVIHRDVKPSNIMLDAEGRPHVMDFGLARRDAGDVTVTPTGEVLGTPAYMSPELARGEGHQVNARSDVFSLGVILYELLTRQRPFQGNRRMLLLQVLEDDPVDPRRLDDRIPRDLETICLKAMHKAPARRYESADELAADLRRFLHHQPIEARPMRFPERSWRWCQRNPLPASVIAILALSSVVGFWNLSSLSDHLVRSSAEESAVQYAELLEVVNDLYSSEVVERVNGHDVGVLADYRSTDGAIPLPATLLTRLLDRVSEAKGSGMQGRHYSNYPFRSRPDGGPQDDFGREALRYLQDHPDQSFSRVESLRGRTVLRLARARIMQESCVTCHNSHPDSIKTDWQIGDVRGVLEIIRPLDGDEQRIRDGMRLTFLLTASVASVLLLVVLGITLTGVRRRRGTGAR